MHFANSRVSLEISSNGLYLFFYNTPEKRSRLAWRALSVCSIFSSKLTPNCINKNKQNTCDWLNDFISAIAAIRNIGLDFYCANQNLDCRPVNEHEARKRSKSSEFYGVKTKYQNARSKYQLGGSRQLPITKLISENKKPRATHKTGDIKSENHEEKTLFYDVW